MNPILWQKCCWEADDMKHHKFWAWGMVICLTMAMYTGYKHK